MFSVSKSTTFEAAHFLDGHTDPITGGPGKCSNIHGHSYTVRLTFIGNQLSRHGFLIDYGIVSYLLDAIKARFDHQFLNTLPEFSPDHTGRHLPTTAENIAAVCEGIVVEALSIPYLLQAPVLDCISPDCTLYQIEVHETAKSSAVYMPNQNVTLYQYLPVIDTEAVPHVEGKPTPTTPE